jgi:hypothetical protein
MCPRFRRLALCLVLLAVPASAVPRREDRRVGRVRPAPSAPVEPAEVPPSQPFEEVPMSTADVGGVDLAGLLGMLTAVAATLVYARGRRLSPGERTAERRR